jgi:hypothetical protein
MSAKRMALSMSINAGIADQDESEVISTQVQTYFDHAVGKPFSREQVSLRIAPMYSPEKRILQVFPLQLCLF